MDFLNKVLSSLPRVTKEPCVKTVVIIEVRHSKAHYVFMTVFGIVLTLALTLGGVFFRALGIGG